MAHLWVGRLRILLEEVNMFHPKCGKVEVARAVGLLDAIPLAAVDGGRHARLCVHTPEVDKVSEGWRRVETGGDGLRRVEIASTFVSMRQRRSCCLHCHTKTVVAMLRAHEMIRAPSSEKHTAWMPPTGSTGSVGFSGFSGL